MDEGLARVTGVGPLRIKLDVDDQPLPIDVWTLTEDLVVGDRVWYQLHEGRIIVHSRAGSVMQWTTMPAAANWTAYSTYGGGVPYGLPQYRRTGHTVEISGGWVGYTGAAGSVNAGSVFAILQPLPAGFRPTRVLRMPVASELGGAWAPSELVMYDGGQINWLPRANVTLNPSGNTWIAIPPLRFQTA